MELEGRTVATSGDASSIARASSMLESTCQQGAQAAVKEPSKAQSRGRPGAIEEQSRGHRGGIKGASQRTEPSSALSVSASSVVPVGGANRSMRSAWRSGRQGASSTSVTSPISPKRYGIGTWIGMRARASVRPSERHEPEQACRRHRALVRKLSLELCGVRAVE